MAMPVQALVMGAAQLCILAFFCALIGVYHGATAGVSALVLVVLAYAAGASRRP